MPFEVDAPSTTVSAKSFDLSHHAQTKGDVLREVPIILKKKLNLRGTTRLLRMIPRDLKPESRQRWTLFGNSLIVVHGQKT